ncbi:MAG: cytochrome c3 family protein [Desulfovibrionaceae bacterium]|nr:cytochrome c3 family protein [Desulfovibrionaceae bacterium]
MRYFIIALFVVALLGATEAQAQGEGLLFKYKQPIELKDGTSKRMHVTFNHTTHKDIACRSCHHEGLPENRYASCTNEACHSLKGASERDPMSLFMAYHSTDERSCYGCHKKEAANNPDFRGCRPCHMSPQARIAMEKAQAAKQK